MSKILFVINPVAGSKSHNTLVEVIKKQLPGTIDVHFEIWNSKEKFSAIRERILSESFDKIVAAGGDGTLSLISQLAKQINTPLGILPTGSGNGYARHLKIPLKLKDAIQVVLSDKIIEVDTAVIDGTYFINIAGLGFDALISDQFSRTKNRGIVNYAMLIFNNLFSYQPKIYNLFFNNHEWNGKAVVVDFALGTQYGNNAVIAPHSDPSDGKLDICILKPYPFLYNFILLYRFYSNSIHLSKYYKGFKSDKVKVRLSEASMAQYDGEAVKVAAEFMVEVSPDKLKVLVP